MAPHAATTSVRSTLAGSMSLLSTPPELSATIADRPVQDCQGSAVSLESGAPGRIRTLDPQFRRLMLCPLSYRRARGPIQDGGGLAGRQGGREARPLSANLSRLAIGPVGMGWDAPLRLRQDVGSWRASAAVTLHIDIVVSLDCGSCLRWAVSSTPPAARTSSCRLIRVPVVLSHRPARFAPAPVSIASHDPRGVVRASRPERLSEEGRAAPGCSGRPPHSRRGCGGLLPRG